MPRFDATSVMAFGCYGTRTNAYRSYDGYPVDHTINFLLSSINIPSTQKKVFPGPTEAFGADACNIVADVVVSDLEALAQGRTRIVKFCHSRGAIIAVMAAAELYKLLLKLEQAATKNQARQPLLALLQADPDNSKIDPLLKRGYQHLVARIRSLKVDLTALRQLRFGLFLIDPVPGGNYMGLPTGWRDPAMRVLTPNVSLCYTIVARDEHSSPFKPVISLPLDPERTRAEYFIVRGSHCAQCGGINDQLGKPPLLSPHGESHVSIDSLRLEPQQLTLMLGHEFCAAFGLSNDYRKLQTWASSSQGAADRTNMAAKLEQYVQKNELEQKQLMLDSYMRMSTKAADKYFSQFHKTHYGFGVESYDGQRLVHIGSPDTSHLPMIPGAALDDEYLDARHQQLAAEIRHHDFMHQLGIGEQHGLSSMQQLTLMVDNLFAGNIAYPALSSGQELHDEAAAAIAGLLETIITLLANRAIAETQREKLQQQFIALRRRLREQAAQNCEAAPLALAIQSLISHHLGKKITELRADLAKAVCSIDVAQGRVALLQVQAYRADAKRMIAGVRGLMPVATAEVADSELEDKFSDEILQLSNISASLEEISDASLLKSELCKDNHQLCKSQKLAKITYIKRALEDYQHWMLEHTTGCKVTNWCQGKGLHLFHGASGRERVASLLEFHQRFALATTMASERAMDKFFELVEQARKASGVRKHSLARYLHGALDFDDNTGARHYPHDKGDFEFFLIKHGFKKG